MGAGGSRIGEKLKLDVNGSHKAMSLTSLRTNFGHQIYAHFVIAKGLLNWAFRLQNMLGMTTSRNNFFIIQQSENILCPLSLPNL